MVQRVRRPSGRLTLDCDVGWCASAHMAAGGGTQPRRGRLWCEEQAGDDDESNA